MVLSARADEHAQRDAVRAGADDVLAKPLDPAELERGLIAAERLVTMHRRMTSDLRRDPVTGAGSRVRLDEDLAALCARVDALRARLLRGDDRAGAGRRRRRPPRRARRSAQEIRSGDVLYRYGPAQFVVLLPEQGLETANLAANRLRTRRRAGRPGRDGDQRRDRHDGHGARAGGAAGRGGGDARRRPPRRRAGCCTAAARAARVRLLVADDDPVSRLMLSAILKRQPDFEVVGEADDAKSGDRARAAAAAGRRPAGREHARRRRRAGRGRDPRRAARREDRRDQRRRLAGLSVRHDARGRGRLHREGLAGRRDPPCDPSSARW